MCIKHQSHEFHLFLAYFLVGRLTLTGIEMRILKPVTFILSSLRHYFNVCFLPEQLRNVHVLSLTRMRFYFAPLPHAQAGKAAISL